MTQYVDRERLAEAVRDWIERSREVGHELTSIVIAHDGTTTPVDTIPHSRIPKPPGEKESTEKVDDLIESIAKKIEGDARGWSGTTQQYFVEPYAAHSNRPFASIPFSVQVDDKKRRARTEDATDEGERKMLMRLVDTMHGRMADRHDKIEARSDQRLDKAFEREEKLRNENMALRAMNDEMLTAKEEREALAKERAENAKMKRELFHDLKAYMPVIANRLADKSIVPEGELAPEQKLIRQLVRDLDGPEIAMMIEKLAEARPRVGVMLAELVLKVQDEDVRRSRVAEAAEKIIADNKEKLGMTNGSPPPKAMS